MKAWRAAGLPGKGPREVDRHLHRHRVTRRREQVRFEAPTASLPDGTFVMVDAADHMAMLIHGGRLWHLSLDDGCYYAAGPAPGTVTVLTPRPVVEVLRAGYVPATRLDGPGI